MGQGQGFGNSRSGNLCPWGTYSPAKGSGCAEHGFIVVLLFLSGRNQIHLSLALRNREMIFPSQMPMLRDAHRCKELWTMQQKHSKAMGNNSLAARTLLFQIKCRFQTLTSQASICIKKKKKTTTVLSKSVPKSWKEGCIPETSLGLECQWKRWAVKKNIFKIKWNNTYTAVCPTYT